MSPDEREEVGAIDVFGCTTRTWGRSGGDCRCTPRCAVCGYGRHMGAHGPLIGQPIGSRPAGHQFVPTRPHLPTAGECTHG